MPAFSLRQLSDQEAFDPLTISPETPFTQAQFYGAWQKHLGREVKRFVIERGGAVVAYFQLIKYPLLRGRSYAYIPYGPVSRDSSAEFLNYLRQELKRLAQAEKLVFIRLDFTPSISAERLAKFFTPAPLSTYHSAYFQPRLEWVLDLEPTEAQLLAGINEKNRYSIRLADRKQVSTEIISRDFANYFGEFYRLMSETAARNNFSLHPKNYYEYIFQQLGSSGQAYLVLAKQGQEIVVMELIIIFGGMADHVFGASSSTQRQVGATAAAQWTAIREAKARGCRVYNFGGIASGEIYQGWAGLTRFKQRFGGRELKHSSFFDLVAQPVWYQLYNLRKRLKALKS